jgi:hypothetical protein
MLDQLIPLLGMRVDSKEIKDIFTEWNAVFPKRVTCTANEPTIKGKVEKNCVRLYFGRGGNSRYLKPIPASWEGGYFGIFTMIEFTKKRKGDMPFDVEFEMEADELTEILGEPKTVEFMGITTTWRKNITDKHEFIVSDTLSTDGSSLRSMTVSFIYEADLYTMEEYEKAGF